MDDKDIYTPIFAKIDYCPFDGGLCRFEHHDDLFCKCCLEETISFYKHCLRSLSKKGEK